MLQFILFTALQTGSQFERDDAKPVPQMQVLPLPGNEASVEREGHEISRYHFGPELYRPFLYPLIGPTGKSLTRMGHPRDPNGHSHHNSLWVSHHDVGGVGFWNDAATSKGRIVHRRVNRYEDADDEALIEVINAWIDTGSEGGKTLLEETRTMRFQPGERRQWLLVLDIVLSAPKESVTLGKSNFGMVGVRMAKTIGVHDGGGTIRNSEGAVNEPQVHEKPARWCDYSGPIAYEVPSGPRQDRPDSTAGITLFDHPINPNHPTVFHVRDDGWMGAALTFSAPRTIAPGSPLKLRYGLWVHSGVPQADRINALFDEFAKIGDPPPPTKK